MSPEDELTLHEVAAELGVHYNTVYRHMRRGLLTARRRGGSWRVERAELERYRTRPTPTARTTAHTDWPTHRQRLTGCLVRGDAEASWQLVADLIDGGADPVEIHTELLGPCMREIGESWAAGRLAIEDEHRASAVVQRLLGRLSSHLVRRGRKRGRVIMAAAPGDHHSLPTSMFADLLRGAGYEVIDLGADVPASSLAKVVADSHPLAAVALYAAAPDNEAAIAASLEAARRSLGGETMLIVGGPAVSSHQHAVELGADAWGSDLPAVLSALGHPDARPAPAAQPLS